MSIRRDIIDKEEVYKELRELPLSYKNIFFSLLDCVKIDILYRAVKVIDNPNQIIYKNGAMASLEEIKKYIGATWQIKDQEYGEITWLPVTKTPKTLTRR